MKITRVNVVNANETFLANVTIEKGKFTKIQKISSKPSPTCKYMLPGFIDSHTHGGYGWDFNSLAKNDLKYASTYLHGIGSEGVTTVIGTTVTCSKSDLKNISSNWKNFQDIDKYHVVQGWYIEGPFISKEKKGAHDEKLICPIDLKILDLINKQNKFIKICAVAPEVKNNLELIKKISKNYIVTIGHSACSCDVALQSLVNGAKRIIHLYNQTSEFHHRNPGIVNMAFMDTPMYCELVCDGFHVCPTTLKNTYDIVGPDRIVLITDSLSCKGLPNGDYMLGTLKIYKTDDIARLKKENNIAGSVKTFNRQAKTFMDCTHCSLNEIVKITSVNAAKSIGIDNKTSIIREGYLADFVITDADLNVFETYKEGNLIYKK